VAQDIYRIWNEKAHFFSIDLIPPEALKQIFYRIKYKGLLVDVLINNAGMIYVKPFHKTDPDHLQ